MVTIKKAKTIACLISLTTTLLAVMTNVLYAQDVQQSILDGQQAVQQSVLSSQINGLVLKNLSGTNNSVDEKDFSYNPAPRFKNEVIDALSARSKGANISALKNFDFNTAFTQATRKYHLKYDDAADILAAYHTLNWQIANQVTDLKPATVNAARQQIAGALATNRDIYRNAGNRAMLGEETKVLYVLLQANWLTAQKTNKAKQFSDQVTLQYQQRYHKNLHQIKLDSQGFH